MIQKTDASKHFDAKFYTKYLILFLAPLPPPITGQSVACEKLFAYLSKTQYPFLINLSKKGFKQGISSLGRLLQMIGIFFTISFKAVRADVIYFTNSESVAGNLKDLLIFAVCWHKLDRIVIHLHGGEGMRVIMSRKYPLLRFINTFFLVRLGAVIVLGDRLKSIYEDVVHPSKLHAVPNFANDEFFVSTEVIVEKFANVQPLRLLFLSNLLPGKGHVELLAALEYLAPEVRQLLHVDFAGGFESPGDEAHFRKLAENLQGISINVHGIVHGEQKQQLLSRAHLFCLPTYYPYEGQPISILEAYASGCAVMTTDHSGIFDTFTPGVNGLEVKPRSAESIAQAVEYALTHTQELFCNAINNYRQAQQQYRASAHVETLEKIILSLAQAGHK
jgi:glycosyltransferase involved in cell wall biosynthesis